MEQNNTASQTKSQTQANEEALTLAEYLVSCRKNWKWFIVSLLFLCGVALLYILRQQPVYEREMAVLIQDQDNGGMSDISSAFSSMGLVSSNTNVNNELISLTSPAVMAEVVKRLDLQVTYVRKGKFHGTTLYGHDLPFKVDFMDFDEQEDGGFRMELEPNGGVRLFKFYKITPDGKVKFKEEVKGKIGGEPINTPIGKISITPNSEYIAPKVKKADESNIVYVNRTGLQNTIETYMKKLNGDLMDKEADVISLSIKSVSTQLAVDILNTIVAVYNENWVDDKNKVARATSSFIDDRLKIIESELGDVDSNISKFKSDNLVPDLVEAAKLSMKESSEMSKSMIELTNQMTMCIYLRDYLKNPANARAVIPVNVGIGSPQLEALIGNYNSLLLTRNTLVESSSEKNPLVADYDIQIKGMRESIVAGINGQVASLNKSLKNMQGLKNEATRDLASGPKQAKVLLSVERKQKVMEQLYLYLLQKREENELTQTFTAYNTRIITPPTGSLKPVAPKKPLILGIAFILGLLIPASIIYVTSATNPVVRSRKDLEGMNMPFVGEIPFYGRKSFIKDLKGKFVSKKKKQRTLETVIEAVKEGSRDVVSESFRIVRGNIDFMMRDDRGSNVIMLTSYNAGSGKSFVSYNLCASFALKGKKVLLIDGDLRHGSMSQFVGMPSKGFSNYLTGTTDDWRKLAIEVKGHPGFFIMPIGHRPPNPAELLDSERLGELLNEAKKEYDYVMIDCPPANIVADTKIVSRWVDRTLFIIREGMLNRQYIAEIDALYNTSKYPRMMLMLNASTSESSKGGKYGGYYGGYYSTEN